MEGVGARRGLSLIVFTACLPLARGELWVPGAASTVEVSVEELDVIWDESDGTGSSLRGGAMFYSKGHN